MRNRSSIAVLLGLLFVFVLVKTTLDKQQADGEVFELPSISDAGFDWIGSRIFQNEAAGKKDYLTHWNEGEDFPSLGIGHFIWFPAGVDAPFDEQFPGMVAYVAGQVGAQAQMPAWLRELDPFVAPWPNKAAFDEAWSSAQMGELRDWLDLTKQYQAKYIVSAFQKRWADLKMPPEQRQRLNGWLQALFETPEGLFAVIDYYNFKGLGSNPRERYGGEGWGLIQVLEALPPLDPNRSDCADAVKKFRDAAASRLRLRVQLSPAERNEQRWLEGWLKRLDGYLVNDVSAGSMTGCGFRVTPYLQNPAGQSMTISWLSNDSGEGQLTVWRADGDPLNGVLYTSSPVLAEALFYHPAEACLEVGCSMPEIPFLHEVRVTNLQPGTAYNYRVRQSIEVAGGSFRSPHSKDSALRFIVYADSETEPESTGKHVLWPGDSTFSDSRRYPLDQTTGYAYNLQVIRQRQPAFVAIAGDLVQSGGEQRDWDEFWKHNAALAAESVILPALGNHDYFGGPGDLGGYSSADSQRAVSKYLSYFDLPANGARNSGHNERYYSLDYGAVTLIVLDTTDGLPHRSERDSNWRLRGENDGGHAPDWHEGSEQYDWLLGELQRAQQGSRFTFVMFHVAPYTSGVHGKPPGEYPDRDPLSGLPEQVLTPLFIRYGVDAVFNGHDEMYEHSALAGTEVKPDGSPRPHEIHFLDTGIGGDGLRGPAEDVENPYRIFLAHNDSAEVYGADGILKDGGKHYGHVEVNVSENSDGSWQAQLDAVYVFPLLDSAGRVTGFERRLYDDSTILIANGQE